jgi:hypothetical protein
VAGSTDPTAESIEPPVAGGKPADASGDEPKPPAPPPDDNAPVDDASKVARLDQHRAA